MARCQARPTAAHTYRLEPFQRRCADCGGPAHVAYHSRRTVATLDGLCALTLVVRHCQDPACPRYRCAYRPEEEGHWALPQREFGLDVIALVGTLRFAEHRSVPEIRQALVARGVAIAERTVTHLVQRYEELVALRLADHAPACAPGRAGARHPGARRFAAGCRPRGPVGAARLPLGRGAAGAQPARQHRGRVGPAAAGGRGGPAGSYRRGHLGWAGVDSQCRARRLARGAPSAVPVPLPPGGGQAHLRGRSARQETAQEGGARGAPHRAGAGRPGGRGGGSHTGLLPGAAQRADRRRSPAAVRLRAAAARPARRHPGVPRAGGRQRGLPPELARLQGLLTRGLAATAGHWPAIRRAYGWIHQAAHLLADHAGRPGAAIRADYQALLATMVAGQAALDALAPAVDQFMKVTASYASRLFHCYDVPDLPRTNNDLEHFFGAARYHERRASGRKGAAPGLVVRGAVRLVASAATRLRRFDASELRPDDLAGWRALRQQLATRQATRCAQFRFRKAPEAYLSALEQQLAQPVLPP